MYARPSESDGSLDLCRSLARQTVLSSRMEQLSTSSLILTNDREKLIYVCLNRLGIDGSSRFSCNLKQPDSSWCGVLRRFVLILAERRYAALAFVLLVAFWGSTFAAIKVSLEYSPAILFAGTRTLLCGAAVTIAAVVWGGEPNVGGGG